MTVPMTGPVTGADDGPTGPDELPSSRASSRPISGTTDLVIGSRSAMQATEATDVPGTETSRSGRRPTRRTTAAVLLVVGAVLVTVVLSDRLAGASTTVPLPLLVLPPLALLAGTGLWWSSRRSARAAVPAEPEVGDEDSAEPAEPGGHVAIATLSPRALGAYVSSLEETLAEQDERLHECRRAADVRIDEQHRRHRDRVRLTLLALREVVGDQPGAVALNRAERALDRLDDAPELGRPLLAAQPSGRPGVTFAVAQRVAVEAPTAPSTPAVTVTEPARPRVGTMLEEIFDLVDAPSDDPSRVPSGAWSEAESDSPSDALLDEGSAGPPTEVPLEARRVLPVPAPPVVAAGGRRTRRRLRRRTAVSSP
jgi:hypothetical protein